MSVPQGPWFVRDMRASTMRRLGWTGPSLDQILITDRDGAAIIASGGDNCIVARIKFENRPEELTDGNLADAHMMAAAPDLYRALERMLGPTGYRNDNSITRQAMAALAKARGEGTES